MNALNTIDTLVATSAGKLPPSVAAAAAKPIIVAAAPEPQVKTTDWNGRIQSMVANVVRRSSFSSLLLIWELACSNPTSSLPSQPDMGGVNDLIVSPFFVNGPQDIGLGWRVLTSLERVAVGFGIAAVIGVLVGSIIGQSVWAMRGLDPIFQVLRTVPPLAWLPISLAAFRDSAPSAIFVIFITAVWPVIINTSVGIRNIPQDYRNVGQVLRLNHFEYFWRIMVPAAAPYIFTGLRIGIGCRGSRSLRLKC
jgi:nitrate/nitrite transport system permease protein